MPTPNDPRALADLLSDAGFVAAEEEADELLACAGGDLGLLDAFVRRRLTGEPLAWITGSVSFCGVEVRVAPGVYVPRWQSEELARRAVERLPPDGAAIDVCTGSGAIAKTLATARPGARIVATDIDERAVACAAANGVEVYHGDLFAPLPRTLEGGIDVVVGVVPYVPTEALSLLQRDTLAFESTRSYDGGADGTELLRTVLTDSLRFLRRGGALLLELGGGQAEALGADLVRLGYEDAAVLVDEDGDVRGIQATVPYLRRMPIEIQRVRAEATAALRQQVLRPHQTVEDVARGSDGETDAVYFAAVDQGVVIGTASVRPEAAPWAPDHRPSWRLRGMATAEGWRGNGVGRAILDTVVDHVRREGGGLLWCNARIPAVPFYERAGLVTRGEAWVDPMIGPHVAMETLIGSGAV